MRKQTHLNSVGTLHTSSKLSLSMICLRVVKVPHNVSSSKQRKTSWYLHSMTTTWVKWKKSLRKKWCRSCKWFEAITTGSTSLRVIHWVHSTRLWSFAFSRSQNQRSGTGTSESFMSHRLTSSHLRSILITYKQNTKKQVKWRTKSSSLMTNSSSCYWKKKVMTPRNTLC